MIETLVEVRLKSSDDFLKIKETLSRIGVANNQKKELYQTCHILHKRGKYYITHFKELFLLDGKESTLSEDDTLRRNTIVNLLEDWNLLEIVNPDQTEFESDMKHIKVVAYKDKANWTFIPKYTIGKPKVKHDQSQNG